MTITNTGWLLVMVLLVSAHAQQLEDDPPANPAARASWINQQLKRVVTKTPAGRDAAIHYLVRADKDGDCVNPLLALVAKQEKNVRLVVAIIRGLGRDGLLIAAPELAKQLRHKDRLVRGNAAVSLEYIGSDDKKVVAALRKHLTREKDVAIAHHAYRALGRCGSKDKRVRALLMERAIGARSGYASYGPLIGLAYCEGDTKAMRGVEKLLMEVGVPGSSSGASSGVKRTLVSWTLANIGDKKSARFVRKKVMARLQKTRADWVDGLMKFYEIVARVCDGEEKLLIQVEEGVRGAVKAVEESNRPRYSRNSRNLMDECRSGRRAAGFTPRGDNILNVGEKR